ncbi:MAG: hypothetical protein L3J32_12660 [Rhizobiaceae bacterium]|nr:hypothetical protein [Rhizobiaceae bacterium]
MRGVKKTLSALGRAIDPKRDFDKEIPRPLLLTKYAIEYIFRTIGYFILLSLVVGLSLSICSKDPLLSALPLVLGGLLMLYLTITTIGIPVFLLIGEIEHVIIRRVISYLVIIGIFIISLYLLIEAPIFDFLVSYIRRFFPAAFNCKGGILELE